jgi:putative SOS response-associated peptidase YedK
MLGEPETLIERFGAGWITDKPRDNRFDPVELRPKSRAYVIRQQDSARGLDVMFWDVLGGATPWPMTNVRNLALPQWKALASKPEQRCLIPLTEFCEWTPDKHDLGDGKPKLKGEMWFALPDQPIFAVAGFWHHIMDGNGFAMVTCDPNDLVAPIHPKAMITILHPDDHDRWLTGTLEDVVALQQPYDERSMNVRGPSFPTRAAISHG